MNPEQLTLIQHSFTAILNNPEHVAALFYRKLFEAEPNLRTLFPDDLSQQNRKFIFALDMLVRTARTPERLAPEAAELGKKHLGYRVRPEYFEPFGKALMSAFREYLRGAFTPEVETAWMELYRMLAGEMAKAMQSTGSVSGGAGSRPAVKAAGR
jgi:hemoglobin-like flavoprotein